MNRRLLTLLIFGLALAQVMGAEMPSTQSATAAPDLSKPVWVIIQCDTVKPLTQEQRKTLGALANGPFYRYPAGAGFAWEQGKPTRPWFSMLRWYGAGQGVDSRTGTHTPISYPDNDNPDGTIAQLTATLDKGQLAARWQGNYVYRTPDPVAFDLEVTAPVTGTRIEGTWKGTIGGVAATGTCVGAIVPTTVPALDPANAVYQVAHQKFGTMVFEVRQGKGTVSLARSLKKDQDGYRTTTLVAADASGLSVTVDPPSVVGSPARLSGVVKLAEGGEVTLDNVVLTPTGYGGNLADPKNQALRDVSVRAYALGDPLTAQWKRWMQAIFTGAAPVDPALAEQNRRETETLAALPPPGQATQFWHRYPDPTVKTFVYAPWLDFQSVPGAKTYRYTVGKASFDADTPNALLTPVWKDLKPGRERHTVTLTGLAADGTPVGEAQKRELTRRPPFGALAVPSGLTDDALAQELALRYPRAIAERHYANIVALWAELTPPHDPPDMNSIRTCHNPFTSLAHWSSDPVERARAARLAEAWKVAYIPRLRSTPFGTIDDYYAFGFTQQTLNDYLSAHEATGSARLFDEVRHWTGVQTRLIQPTGSWTWYNRGGGFSKDPWTPFFQASSYYGRTTMDHDAAPYVNFLGRLRRSTGDDRHRDSELKGLHYLCNNGLRTGYWPAQCQQSGGSDDAMGNTMAVETLEYLLERAPATLARTVLAEELARYIEDRWITWGPISRILGGTMTNSGQVPMALNYLRLYRDTGKALYRAKAEALFHSYFFEGDPGLQHDRDLVLGTPRLVFLRTDAEADDPVWALRYLDLRRELGRAPKTPPPTPANAVAVLRLEHGVAQAAPLGQHLDLQLQRQPTPAPQPARDPVFLHLDVQGGTVRYAIATTPTWDGPILDFPQCGRLHWQEGRALFHAVDTTKLTVGPQGLSGEVVVQIKAPMPDRQPVATTFRIETTLDGRQVSGRHDGGQVAGELLPPVSTKPERVWFEVDRAVLGGEAWQNWAVAQFDLPGVAPRKDRAPRSLSNNNAGWSATIEASDLALTETTLKGSFRAKVDFFGFRDGLKEDAKYHETAWEQGLSFLAYWNTSETFFGRRTGGKKESRYTWHTNPKPQGEHIEYMTLSKPVTAGSYEYRFDGCRLGAMVAGTMTVKGPDGTERTCQFLGGVE